MHSRIYVLARKNSDYNVPDIEDLYNSLIRINPLTDYVYFSENFENDIEWLAQYYKLHPKKENGVYVVGRKELLKSLREERGNNILEAKAILCHKELKNISSFDLFRVARLIQNNDGFLFYFDGVLLTPNDLIDSLEDSSLNKLEIVKSYDYHF